MPNLLPRIALLALMAATGPVALALPGWLGLPGPGAAAIADDDDDDGDDGDDDDGGGPGGGSGSSGGLGGGPGGGSGSSGGGSTAGDGGSSGGSGGGDGPGGRPGGPDGLATIRALIDRLTGAGQGGEGRATEGEVLAMGIGVEALARAFAAGFRLRERSLLPEVGVAVARLEVPAGTSVQNAIELLERLDPAGVYSANHLYDPSTRCADPRCYGARLVGFDRARPACGVGISIGMLDTRVDARHPALGGKRISIRRFAPPGTGPSPSEHGTAVATILAGAAAEGASGLLAGVRLSAADVFWTDASGRLHASALTLAQGLDWLVGAGVVAVNASLAGPRNPVVEAAVRAATRRGIPVVAAAGNGGPRAAPAFPAAYPGVVAITAVDRELRPFRNANRGGYLTFAAPGVEIAVVESDGSLGQRSGTSFATPFATAVIAARLAAGRGGPADGLIAQLAREALDLGDPGHDPIFGFGLIRGPACG